MACSLAFHAVEHPFHHAHILAITRPDKFAFGIFAEPVDAINGGQFCALCLQLGAHIQPVLEIIAHVVANKGQHGEGIAAYHALRAKGGGGGF